MSAAKKGLSELIKSMDEEPDKWEYGYLTFKGPGGIEVWQSGMGIYHPKMSLGPIGTFRLAAAVSRLRWHKLIRRLRS